MVIFTNTLLIKQSSSIKHIIQSFPVHVKIIILRINISTTGSVDEKVGNIFIFPPPVRELDFVRKTAK